MANEIKTPDDFFEALSKAGATVAEIADAVDTVRTAVPSQRAKSLISASWYVGLCRVAERHGVDCPHDIFGFRGVRSVGDVDQSAGGVS